MVVRTEPGKGYLDGSYFLTVFNLSTRAVILEKTIPWTYNPTYPPLVELSRDGRLLAWLDTQRLVVIWDLDAGKDCHLQGGPASLQLSPDGKLLATRDVLSSSEVRLFDTTTGALAHTINLGDKDLGYRAFGSTTAFSPDSRFVAVDGGQEGAQLRTIIQLIDTASGKECFRTQGFRPQFLPGGSLLGIRGTGHQMPFGEGGWEVLETVVWSSAGWTEMRAFPYDLGVSLFSGPVVPQASPNGRPDQFGLNVQDRRRHVARFQQGISPSRYRAGTQVCTERPARIGPGCGRCRNRDHQNVSPRFRHGFFPVPAGRQDPGYASRWHRGRLEHSSPPVLSCGSGNGRYSSRGWSRGVCLDCCDSACLALGKTVSRSAAIWSFVIGSIMTTSKKSSRRWAIVLVISAVILLAITWHFAGYERDEVISLSRVYPLALTSDGATLIVGSGRIP